VVPLDVLPVYTKAYCRKYHLPYVSEYGLAARWIEQLKESGLFTDDQLKQSVFLLDAGFDTKRIQCAVRALGAHFVVAIKKCRAIGGHNVAEYFRRHRHLSWNTIRLKAGSGS